MRSIAPLTCLGLMLAASPAFAMNWFPGSSAPIATASDLPRDAILGRAASDHVASRASELGLAEIELASARVVRTAVGRVVHLEQRVGGVPVLGGGAVVHVAPDGTVRRIGVDIAHDLAVDTVPSIDADEARDDLEVALGRAVPEPARAELVIGRMGTGHLLWQLDVRDSAAGSRYWVDAHDGAVVMRRSLAIDAQGTVYTVNSVDTPTPADVELALLDTAAAPIHLNGWSGLLTVTQYVAGSSMSAYDVDQTLVPSSGQDFLYPPPVDPLDATDAFAQVNLYYHLTAIRTLFQSLGAPVTDASWKLTAVANATEDGAPLDNAFFSPMGIDDPPLSSPNLIVIGQGSLNDFAYDSDVFKHEFGHYVSTNAINYNLGQANFDELGLSPFSGSIDEGIADYFACSDNDDPELGEASLFPLNAGRDLTNTTKTCPNDMLGEVHADGEIIGSVSWSVRELVGKGLGDRLIWGAISTLNPGGNFDDFAKGILSTADDLVASGDLTAVQKTGIEGILAERGLDNCGRIIPLAPGETGNGFIIGLNLVGQLLGGGCAQAQQFGVEIPSLFHYSWKPASGDVGLKVTTNMTPDAGGDLDYTIFARANQPVHFDTGGGFIPTVDQSDFGEIQMSEAGELIIDATTDPAFDASATYDFIVVSRSCADLIMEFSVAAYEAPPIGEGGGGAGAGGDPSTGNGGEGGTAGGGGTTATDDDGDCGCKVVRDDEQGNPIPAFLALGALGVIAGRRRRR